MIRFSKRRAIVAGVLGLVVASAAVGVGSTAAAKSKDTVKITVAPKTGKYGTHYNINVSGKANTAGEQLALSMTSAPGSCPTDYAAGFASLSGIANSKGKPIAPKSVHGTLKMIVKAKITISQPGTYGICAYLNVGSVTKAHAASHFTIPQ